MEDDGEKGTGSDPNGRSRWNKLANGMIAITYSLILQGYEIMEWLSVLAPVVNDAYGRCAIDLRDAAGGAFNKIK
jgi:hypothetical protein